VFGLQDLWVWVSGFGSLGLGLWVWVSGFGSLGLGLWVWVSGFGFGDPPVQAQLLPILFRQKPVCLGGVVCDVLL
jgi:hypothetical protein